MGCHKHRSLIRVVATMIAMVVLLFFLKACSDLLLASLASSVVPEPTNPPEPKDFSKNEMWQKVVKERDWIRKNERKAGSGYRA